MDAITWLRFTINLVVETLFGIAALGVISHSLVSQWVMGLNKTGATTGSVVQPPGLPLNIS